MVFVYKSDLKLPLVKNVELKSHLDLIFHHVIAPSEYLYKHELQRSEWKTF